MASVSQNEEENPNILHGPSLEVKIPNISIGQLVFQMLKNQASTENLMHEAESRKTVTSKEFIQMSVRVATALKKAGLKVGDIVCIIGKASIETYAAATGSLFEGGVVAPMDKSIDPAVIQLLLQTIKPRFVFSDAECLATVNVIFSKLENMGLVIVTNYNQEKDVTQILFKDFIQGEVDLDKYKPNSVNNVEDQLAFLVCSSGTRGTPKPVMITHRNIHHQIQVWRIVGGSNRIFTGPAITFSLFYWISGVLLYLFVLCMNFEMTIVTNLEPVHILQVIERKRPMWGMFSPQIIKDVTFHADFKKHDVSSVLLILTAGCSLQKPLVEEIRDNWGPQAMIRQAYGLTEVTGSVTTSSKDDDTLSVGRLLPGFAMKVVSLDDGSILGPRSTGEIYLRSPTVMKGYMNNDEETKAVIINGWFRTEDLGYFLESGSVFVTGRARDIIRCHNKQIHPQELEDLICCVPGVHDVGVTGIKQDSSNTLLVALIMKKEGHSVTKEAVQQVIDGLPEHKRLRGGIYFVESIPRTTSGKMKRGDLLKLAESLVPRGRS